MEYCYINSPIGALLLAGDAAALMFIGLPEGKGRIGPAATWSLNDKNFSRAKMQLTQYFDGDRKVFDLPLTPSGTEFQLSVWRALRLIPYGETRSYGQIAEAIDKPKAVRAVGAANGKNPLPIVVPCHRVIGADGSLTGFGGGLAAKSYLLELESAGLRSQMDSKTLK